MKHNHDKMPQNVCWDIIDSKIHHGYTNVNNLRDSTLRGSRINGYKITGRQSEFFFFLAYMLAKSQGKSISLTRGYLTEILGCSITNISRNIIKKLEELELISVRRFHDVDNNKTHNYYNINWEKAHELLGDAILGDSSCKWKREFIAKQIAPKLDKTCVHFVHANILKPKGFSNSISSKKVFSKNSFIPLSDVDIAEWLPIIKEMAIKDNIDDGKIEYHLGNLINFYLDPSKCSLTSKLQLLGKKFMVNCNGLYALFKKWINRLLNNKTEKEEEEEMAKREKAKKLAPENILLYESSTGIEDKLIRTFGKDSFVSWFGEKNNDTNRWRCRFPVEWCDASSKWIMKVSNHFHYSKFTGIPFYNKLEQLNIQITCNKNE